MKEIDGYAIKEMIYSGTNSEIFKAIREKDNRAVIIKLLNNENPSTEQIQKFKYEYDIARNINIDGVITNFDYIITPNIHAIVMEDIDGISISKILKKNTLKLKTFLFISIKLCEILSELNRENIIHKDIKPANIVLNTKNGEIKLIDFSLATKLTKEKQSIINPDKLEGTLAYISPEQTGRMNRSIDYRSDFYSLGVTFYQILTNRLPFSSTDPMELVHSHIAVIPPFPSVIKPEIPSVISEIVMKLLSKNAEDRYQGASGLKTDLANCYRQLKENNDIKDFEIALEDVSERFQIPEKLYGREKEIEHLMSIFSKAASGRKEMVYYSGVSGIGKSALINEIHKPMVEKRGHFISGKYDQFKKNIPYSSIIQAFQELARHLLTEDETVLDQWKKSILKAVGKNGKVITDVIPGIELIIGQQQDIQELSAAEGQNRFNMVFQNFIRVLATKEHPLVIFLDDLQWADNASLQLLDILLSDMELNYFLFIGAYRNNEVDGSHPLSVMFKKMKEEGMNWEDIEITPLSELSITDLLADTLFCTQSKVREVASFIFNKTNGNPFFVTEFLKTLYFDSLISFQNGWKWNISGIKQAEITDNVIELMADKIKKQDEKVLNLLKIASVIGSVFYLDTLSMISGLNEDVISGIIIKPINDGMILQIDEKFKFIHDKIQEAAYSLLNEEERIELHYKIGKILLGNAQNKGLIEKHLFNIVNQLNPAITLFTNTEKSQMLKLNMQAGKKAKASAAYDSAKDFLKIAAELLPENSWEIDYETTLPIYMEWSEAEYLTGCYKEADILFKLILKNAKSKFDKLKVFTLELSTLLAQLKSSEAMDKVILILKTYKIRAARNPGTLSVLNTILKTKSKLSKKVVNNIPNFPLVTDPEQLAIFQLLSFAAEIGYQLNPNLMTIFLMKLLNLSVKYGNSPLSPFAYIAFGSIIQCAALGDITNGCKISQKGMELLEKTNNLSTRGRCYYIYSWGAIHIEKFNIILEYAKKCIQYSLDSGDLLYAGWACTSNAMYQLFIGYNLNKVMDEFNTYTPMVKKLKQPQNETFYLCWKQCIENLLGNVADINILKGSFFDEKEAIPFYYKVNEATGLAHIYVAKMIVSVIFENFSFGKEIFDRRKLIMDASLGQSHSYQYHFYCGLFVSALYYEKQRKNLNLLKKSLGLYKKWSENQPDNFLNKYLLLLAEFEGINGNYTKAEELYKKSIKAAKSVGFLHEQALACEFAARHYSRKGNNEKLSEYINKAYSFYKKWGCKTKLKLLKEKYPQYIKEEELTVSSSETSTSSSSGSGSLDITTIMKATQAISSEIEMKTLLEKMIKIVIENAGAQKGILILKDNDKYLIEAENDINSGALNVMKSIPLDENSHLSSAIVRYVSKTGEDLVLDNAIEEDIFKSDSYIINNKPKSILCCPIQKQNNLIGILYLENNLTQGAFTKNRVKTLNILSSQIAISIENAKLIENMKEGERLKQEMEIAERIQTSLLPYEVDIPEFEIVADMITADEVGGDYYEFRKDQKGNLWLAIGDVSGHGVTPGLFMMMAQTSLSSLLNNKKREYSPTEAVTLINRTLYDNVNTRLKETHFMTFNLIKYMGEGRFIHAGAHLDIIIFRDDTKKCELIETSGIFLNMIEDISAISIESEFQMNKNDIMVLYTDGVIEVTNKKGDLLDMNGIVSIIEKNAAVKDLKGLKETIVEETLNWCNHKPTDDISLVVVKRLI